MAESMIPSWLSSYANEKDLREIESAVASAESFSSGEIVPMIVRESSLSGHVPMIVTLLWFSFFMIALPTVEMRLPGYAWMWDIAAAVFACVLGWTMARLSVVRRLFTSAHDQAQSVFHRAQLEFHETGIPATTGRTGVLIFVSLQERRAVILGDRAISEHVAADAWVSIIDGLLKSMRAGQLREGFTGAIARVGEVLTREFPASAHDQNELPNTLVVKD